MRNLRLEIEGQKNGGQKNGRLGGSRLYFSPHYFFAIQMHYRHLGRRQYAVQRLGRFKSEISVLGEADTRFWNGSFSPCAVG